MWRNRQIGHSPVTEKWRHFFTCPTDLWSLDFQRQTFCFMVIAEHLGMVICLHSRKLHIRIVWSKYSVCDCINDPDATNLNLHVFTSIIKWRTSFQGLYICLHYCTSDFLIVENSLHSSAVLGPLHQHTQTDTLDLPWKTAFGWFHWEFSLISVYYNWCGDTT